MAKRRLKYTGLCCLVGLGVVGCQVQDPAPFDPRRTQEAERSLAREVEQRPMSALPTTLQSNYVPQTHNPDGTIKRAAPMVTQVTGPLVRAEDVRRMSLQEIIQRAVANNRDVRVAGYDPAIEQTRITEAEANFDPTLFANYQLSDRDDETAGTAVPNPANPATNRVFFYDDIRSTQYQAGVRENLESGGQVELRQQLTSTHENPSRTVEDPYYESQLVLEITQPVLKNFGTVINRARIDIARSNTRISVLDFRKSLEETLFNIEKLYWQQVQAERNVAILERLLQRTENTADILLKRFGQEVSRVQTSQAAAQVEARRASLIRARAQVMDISFQIKRLMNDPDLPVSGGAVILPSTAPVVERMEFDPGEQIDAAMENRFDLAQQLLRIEAAGIVAKVAKNNLLPTLNLVAGAGAQGNRTEAERAWYAQNSFDNFNYKVGFQFEVPIGNRAARAIFRRSMLQRYQAIEQYEALVDQAGQEVRQALNDLGAAWDGLYVARGARFAAENALESLQERESHGDALTPDFVNRKLQEQSDLAQQEQSEAEAIASYQTAIAQLERAKGTLLRYNNVEMSEKAVPFSQNAQPSIPHMAKNKYAPMDQ